VTVKLIATDLDGTLLDTRGEVTNRTAAAVAAARKAGIHVVPVTGRPPQALWEIAAAANLGPYGVCSNGAALVDIERSEVVEVEALAGEIATRLVGLVRAAEPEILLAVDDLERFCYERGFFVAPDDWQQNLVEVDDIRSVVAGGCVKLIARCPGTSAMELIRRLEVEIAEEGHVTTAGLDWVDIGAPGVSKAYALQRVCDRLGVHVSEVVAIGDNHNDLPVLGWAGTAMAPANAIAEALAMADRVLAANSEDGVAQLLEELVRLGR
jgi:Cof subfamily protein (haloacid dehalogenase superfamily)